MLRSILTLVALVQFVSPLNAQTSPLPVVDDVEWTLFKNDCRTLFDGFEKWGVVLPEATTLGVTKILQNKPEQPRAAAQEIQKLLDQYSLVGIHINPESRVKAVRGPRTAVLIKDQPIFMLVKIHNEGGVTHGLAVRSPQAIRPGKKAPPDCWLEVSVVNEKPFRNRLTGRRVEYRLLKVIARQAGKREATLAFDVGQGSEDLGFRAEVPILFTVRSK